MDKKTFKSVSDLELSTSNEIMNHTMTLQSKKMKWEIMFDQLDRDFFLFVDVGYGVVKYRLTEEERIARTNLENARGLLHEKEDDVKECKKILNDVIRKTESKKP